MDIKFSNCSVPIWKCRIGAVVAFANDHENYGHIANFCTKVKKDIYLIITIGKREFTMKPEELVWLEPQ